MPEASGLFWDEHGPADAPVLILSSGLGGSAGYWQSNLAALAQRHRVIAYDHRGTGRSSREVPGDLTIQAMAADLALLIRETGVVKPTLIGHAIGGLIGLAAALAEPALLARLVVINGWARLDPHTARCFDTRLSLLRDSGARAYLHAQPLFLYPAPWISDHHARLADEEEAGIAHFPGAEMVQRRIAAARRFDLLHRLPDIAVPTLLVASDDDMLVPHGCSDVLAKGLPDAQLARMASGGHACNITRADHFNMWLLDWLDSEAE
ncbi:pyrimidine utilization protein D [Sphingomonas bacterium]|uniref:pyrimidine utilization protein D n=1 Tax=Sphingomonas bacterium TaxID=1895847 RepID=UPI0015762FC6|nr:pyrimidine utilization protein D [Sphingomonas bacterium]